MMKHLHIAKNDKFTLSAKEGTHNIEWHADAAFAVHPDFKSHAGACQPFGGGKGAMQSISVKQKLNASSSTTAELAGADQVPPLTSWTPSFLEA